MFCPKCGDEYRPGFTECMDCHVPLVPEPPDEDAIAAAAVEPGAPDPDLELVTVFESGDTALVSIAKSILQSAGVLFTTSNEGLRDRFGYGVSMGPVGLLVGSHDAEEALALLGDLADSEPDLEALDAAEDADDEADGEPESAL